MGFWIFMLAMDMMLPLMMIVFGTLFRKNPPKEINSVFGYRTSMSMKNKDTWDFAHKFCGKLWHRQGLAMLPVSAAALSLFTGRNETEIGMAGGILCIIQLAFLTGSVIFTEAALKQHFDRNGNRRHD